MKIIYKYETEAKILCDAIRNFNESSLQNFENYLSVHFGAWMEKYANNPENLAGELQTFSEIK